MRREEDELPEENSLVHLESCIHWITQINESRLYWLWVKFFIASGASAGWVGFSKASPVLDTIKPITNSLSFTIFGARFVMQSLWLRQQGQHNVPASEAHITRLTCLNDFLWGLSNFISAQGLHSKALRPSLGTPGWWGHLCMEILLVNDVIFTALQFKHEDTKFKDKVNPSNEQTIMWDVRKASLWNNLLYSINLTYSYFLFQGFSTPIAHHVPANIGAGLCVMFTNIFRAVAWVITLSQVKNSPHAQHTYVGAGISIGLDLTLPLLIWISSSQSQMILVIALGLGLNTLIHGYFKQEKTSTFNACSFFSPRQRGRMVSLSSEITEQPSLV